jgi:hypothetical protein
MESDVSKVPLLVAKYVENADFGYAGYVRKYAE